MFRQSYKSMYSQIQPDAELLADTKNKISSNRSLKGLGKMKITRIGALAACVVIVAVAFKLGQPQAANLIVTSSSGQTSSSSGAGDAEIKTVLQSGHNEAVVQLSNGVLNFIDADASSASAKLYFDPKTTHEEEWTQEKAVQYLGKDVRPGYLPEVFSKTEQTAGKTNQFIVMNNDGTVAYDNISYYYNGDPDDAGAPSLSVKVSKGKLPRDCVLYRSDNQAQSNINGHKLSVGYQKVEAAPRSEGSQPAEYYDLYFSEFVYEGIGYRIVSERLTQAEFIKVLQSIVK